MPLMRGGTGDQLRPVMASGDFSSLLRPSADGASNV
jgi:hypothetical protein